jgi:hypothetical protein
VAECTVSFITAMRDDAPTFPPGDEVDALCRAVRGVGLPIAHLTVREGALVLTDPDRAAALREEVASAQIRVEDLRAFEREYRRRMRAYHQRCINELDGTEASGG